MPERPAPTIKTSSISDTGPFMAGTGALRLQAPRHNCDPFRAAGSGASRGLAPAGRPTAGARPLWPKVSLAFEPGFPDNAATGSDFGPGSSTEGQNHMALKKSIIPAVVAVLLMAGCGSTQYIISTTDGTMIQANGKPKLNSKTGMYEYQDSEGRAASIKQDQVKQILER